MILLNTLNFTFPFKDPIVIFAVILFIILIAPLILNKLKIPHLIGLIIAGAIIGPNGFNMIMRDSSFELFGTVGILYIMFIAGLDMDLNDFKKNSQKSLVFGLSTFAFPMVFGILAGYYILGFPLISSILIGCMLSSHTLIAYPIVTRFGVGKNPAVNITVGGTIITDTLALLVLTVVSRMSTDGITQEFWIRLVISLVIYLLMVVYLFPFIARLFFKYISDNVSQYIFVLEIVFLSAFFAMIAGVEGVIGAFFAGLALNRLIPRTSPLMNRIEFVGNALFIPFFLIGVGMLIDFKIFFSDIHVLWVAFIITSIALLGKYIAAFLTQRLFKYSKDQLLLIFGLSNSRAAATLAIVIVGYQLGLLGDDVLNAVVLMILVTCTISSFATQKGAQNVAMTDLTDPDDSEDDIANEERFLISVNNPDMVVRLVNLSIILKNSKSKNNLYALNIIKNTELENGEAEKRAGKLLELASKTAAATDNNVTELLRYDSDISNAMISTVKEQKITDLVLGLHEKKHISDSFFGTLTEGILSKCNTTIFIYRPVQPLATVKRHLVVIPKNADKEIGFPFWLSNVWNIGKNAKTKMIFYASEETISYIKLIDEKQPINAEYNVFDNWTDFPVLAKDIKQDDSITIIMSREDRISYTSEMEKIPSYLNKYFQSNNFILIYPVQMIELSDNEIDRSNPSLDYNRFAIFRKKVQKLLSGK